MRRILCQILAFAIFSSVLTVTGFATATPQLGAQEACVGSVDGNIAVAKDNYSAECGVTYSDSSGFHKCDWVADGWQCQGPQGQVANAPVEAPVTPAPAPATTSQTGESDRCFGSVDRNIDVAKDNYSAECGVTYSDSTGFHKCEWVAAGWQCEGPGSRADNSPVAVETTTTTTTTAPTQPVREVETTEPASTPVEEQSPAPVEPSAEPAPAENTETRAEEPTTEQEVPGEPVDEETVVEQPVEQEEPVVEQQEEVEAEPQEPIGITATGADGSITVTTLRELRGADLPDWAKREALNDLRLLPRKTVSGLFGHFTEAELDEPLETVFVFDPDAVVEAELDNASSPPIDTQLRFRCSRWYDQKKILSFGSPSLDSPFVESEEIGLSGSRDLGNGFTASFESEGSVDGSISIVATIHYEEKRNRCLGGIPYRWNFQYADIEFVSEIDGQFGVNNTLTLEHQVRLWQETIRILTFTKTVPVANILTIDFTGYLDLVLALDLETRLTITHQTDISQGYEIDGQYVANKRCTTSGCEDLSEPGWDLNFTPTDRPSTYSQVTLDATIRPSAELRLGLRVDVGIWGQFEQNVFDGKLGLGVDLPVRLFWTTGNACSDADGDGVNEQVSAMLIDANIRVYAYVEARLLGHWSRDYISLTVPNGWARQQINGVLDRDDRVTVIEKNLLFKVISEGENSPLQPTINHAGLFEVDGNEFEGVELGEVRSCYPFTDTPTVRVNFGNASRLYAVTGDSLAIPYDWESDGAGETVRARIEFDSAGRSIKGPWVEVAIDENGNRPISLTSPVLRLGSGPNGAELQWEDNGAASGFNIYRDRQYVDTVRGDNSWSLAGEDGQEHAYSVVAFNDFSNEFTDRSNEVVFGGSDATATGRPRAIVSMGDSFISGEAGRWTGNALSAGSAGTDRGATSYVGASASNLCNRSDVAEVNSAGIAGLVPINLACSGAESQNVIDTAFRGEAPQVEQLAQQAQTLDIEMIVLSIGGNDLGFGDILAGCMSAYINDDSPCRDDAGVYSKIVNEVVPNVRATVEAIEATMAEAGDTDYRLVLQSYVSPVPRSSEVRYSGSDRIEAGCPFFDTDLDWARDTIVPTLDTMYKQLAAEMDIEFLSLRDGVQGKEVCSDNTVRASSSTPATAAGQEARLEWIRLGNPVVAIGQGGSINELFHPNALGQRAIGDCLAQAWSRTGSNVHTCVRTGATPSDMTVR